MNIVAVNKQFDFNLAYAKALVLDVTEEQMTAVPYPGFENHPAFTLGHLSWGSALLAETMGAPFEMLVGWPELFSRTGPGDPSMPEREVSKYPSKIELLDELEKQHEKVKVLMQNLPAEAFSTPSPWVFERYMPTLADVILYICIHHEAGHLGQVAAWRRAMKLPSAAVVMIDKV